MNKIMCHVNYSHLTLMQGLTWENASSVAIVHCNLEMQSTSTALNSRSQGHLVTLPKGHLG